ncbi:hypothetical protein JXB22_06970 [candidate division WOR-3 bacterium]|nr:hypothetical protein [candidate division WOR-3 bacterium]
MISLITLVVFAQIHHFDFATIPSPQTAGVPFQITCYARDSLGNLVTSYGEQATIFVTQKPQYGSIPVTFNSGIWQGNFIATRGDSTYSLTCQDYQAHTGESNQVNFLIGPPNKLLIILPGESLEQGIESGKSGNALAQAAGVSFDAAVYLTDYYSNIIDNRDDSCHLSSSDGFAPSGGFSLNSGQATVPFTFRTASQQYLIARDISYPSISRDTSTAITVTSGPYGRLLVILPGETSIGGDTSSITPGKLGVPEDQHESQDFMITVYATDTCWNQTYTSGGQVQILSDFQFSNPAPQSLDSGAVIFTLNFTETGRVMLWAEDNATGFESYNNYLNILAVIDTSVTTDSFLVYPNPMGIGTNTMVFAYYLQGPANITFEIYDPFGNLVLKRDWSAGATYAQSGMNRFAWNGRNDKGIRVASGIYYAIVRAWTHTATVFNKKLKVGVVW